MKNIVINIHNDNRTLATHLLGINDKKPLIIQAKPRLNYEFIDAETITAPDHIVIKRGGNNLGILFNNEVKDAGILIIKDFYQYPKNALIGSAEDGRYYYYVPDTAEVSDYVTQLTNNQSSGLALGGYGFKQPWWTSISDIQGDNIFKSIFKSILPDKLFGIETSLNDSNPTSVEQATTSTTKQIYSTKTHKFTEVDASNDNGFLDNLEISPWLIGAGVGLGAAALLVSNRDNDEDKSSTKDEQNIVNKGTEKSDDLQGTDKNDTLNGLSGDDKLNGGDGNDILIGGQGSDILTGGNGSDTFAFKLSDLTDTKAVDTITDFTAKVDKIQLPKALFKTDNVADNLADYIKYDKATGELSYDSDGKGGTDAVVFATLSNHADLTIDSDTFQII